MSEGVIAQSWSHCLRGCLGAPLPVMAFDCWRRTSVRVRRESYTGHQTPSARAWTRGPMAVAYSLGTSAWIGTTTSGCSAATSRARSCGDACPEVWWWDQRDVRVLQDCLPSQPAGFVEVAVPHGPHDCVALEPPFSQQPGHLALVGPEEHQSVSPGTQQLGIQAAPADVGDAPETRPSRSRAPAAAGGRGRAREASRVPAAGWSARPVAAATSAV